MSESQNSAGLDVGLTLRDRIAAILSDTLVADDSIVKLSYGDHGTSQIVVNCNPLADAVIRELGEELPLRPLPAAQEQVHQGLQAPTKDC